MNIQDNKEHPLVSVFTCVYNMADKINRVYKSLSIQTYRNFEHIIVDDGSTDGLFETVEKYRTEVSYPVIYIRKDNGGKHTATNIAWDKASGEYIVQLDADDELLPHAIEYLVNKWNEIPKEKFTSYWCVHGRCCDQIKREMIGKPYPEDLNNIEWRDAIKIVAGIPEEKIGLMKKSVLDHYRYPEPVGVTMVRESLVWDQVNAKYRTWYTNEIVRVYFVNEGGSLSTQKRTRKALTNRCWDARYRLMHNSNRGISMLKYALRYGVAWHFATETYRLAHPYFTEFKDLKAKLAVLVTWCIGLAAKPALKKKWHVV